MEPITEKQRNDFSEWLREVRADAVNEHKQQLRKVSDDWKKKVSVFYEHASLESKTTIDVVMKSFDDIVGGLCK